MKVELLYFDGCPSHARFLPRLRELLAEEGAAAAVEERRVKSPEDAVAQRFLGSPTVRIDGRDIDPDADARTDHGLKCRLYRTPDGLQATPPEQLVRRAIRDALETDGDPDRVR